VNDKDRNILFLKAIRWEAWEYRSMEAWEHGSMGAWSMEAWSMEHGSVEAWECGVWH